MGEAVLQLDLHLSPVSGTCSWVVTSGILLNPCFCVCFPRIVIGLNENSVSETLIKHLAKYLMHHWVFYPYD